MTLFITLISAATVGYLLAELLDRALRVRTSLAAFSEQQKHVQALNETARELSRAWLAAHADGDADRARALRQQAFDAACAALEAAERAKLS